MHIPMISVVIPSYDEMTNLRKGVLEKVVWFLSRKKVPFEVIVVDDGSTDGSIAFVQKFCKSNPSVRLVKNSHQGKAGSVTKGMLEAKGEYILFTDMDQATPIEEIDKLLPHFKKGYDVVIGVRSMYRKGSPFSRVLMSRGVIFLRKLIVGLHDISDTQCGFKMFTRDAARLVFSRMSQLHNGFQDISGSSVQAAFDVELLFLSQQQGYRIREVLVDWLYVETRRVAPLKDSIEGLLGLLQVRLNQISGKYRLPA